MLPLSASAASVTLSWNPSVSPKIAGYNIYYGPAIGIYTNKIFAAGSASTRVSVTGLVPGATYYFGAKAVDLGGNLSPISNVASYTVPVGSVVATNQPPALDPLNNLVIIQTSSGSSGGLQIVNLTGISSGATNQTLPLTVTATSSNPLIIPVVIYTSPNSSGALSITSMFGILGTSIISVTVNNGQKSNNIITRSFIVTVVPFGTTPPQITSQPTNLVVLTGQNITFSVNATGTAPLTYQWKCNSNLLPSATNAVLQLIGVTTNQTGLYTVTVANLMAATNSAAALTVQSTMAATMTPVAPTARGQFTLTVNGVTGYKYAVLATTNFVAWTPVLTNTAPFTFVDTNVSRYKQRYYRSVYIP